MQRKENTLQKSKRLLSTLIVMFAVLMASSCAVSSIASDSGAGSLESSRTSETAVQFIPGKMVEAARADAADAKAVVVTIEDANGNVVFNQKKLDLYNLNGSFISQTLKLAVGNYKLTEFFVLNKGGDAIFITPKEGSKFAHLVTDPCPIEFTVYKDKVTTVTPEVIDPCAPDNGDVEPEDFGYVNFSFKLVNYFYFRVAVLALGADGINLTDAKLKVETAKKVYEYDLKAKTNELAINSLDGDYKVTISKKGYADFTATYTKDEMIGFFANVLDVTLYPAP